MALIHARVACRPPQRILSVRWCVGIPEPYITLILNFVSNYFSRINYKKRSWPSILAPRRLQRRSNQSLGYPRSSNVSVGPVFPRLGTICDECSLSKLCLA